MSAANEVVPGLWVGSYMAANDLRLLKDCRITRVVNLANETVRAEGQLSITVLSFSIDDDPSEDIHKIFSHCCTFIHEGLSKGEGVLVNCRAGVSRSATIVIAYLIAKRGMSLSSALTTTRASRPRIDPNEGFIQQLQQW